jgi:type I restriction enzyme S subunit
MIGRLKPYQAMKDSGVPWLGAVPEHWTVAALRHRYSQCLGKMLDSKRIRGEHSVPYLRNIDVQWDRINTLGLPVMDITEAEYGRYTVQPGDLLVCEGGEVGRAAVWQGTLALCGFQKALHRLRPLSRKDDDPRFIMFVLMAASAAGAFYDGHESTIAHLTGDKLRSHRFPFPDGVEQTAIVRFLDHISLQIRHYIGAKRRLIKLLEEQKQAIIYRAVTRGLNANVRLKPSGVDWLGDVPEHWQIQRNGQLFAQRNETGFPNLPILEVSLRTGIRIRDFELSNRKQVMTDRGKYKKAMANDIAYNMMRMWQGAVDCVPVDGLVSPAYIVARPLVGTHSRYFSNLFRTSAYMDEVDKYSRGIVSDRNRLYWEDFKQMPSPCPPEAEQAEIAQSIQQQTQGANDTIERVRDVIARIYEYRTRLIADAVTGKLDVRATVSALPETAEEPEVIEVLGADDGELDGVGDDEVEEEAA